MAHYLASLPDGLDSHPQCLAKASLYRAIIDDTPLAEEDVADLPPALADLHRHPRPMSSWIPEVHSHAIMLAVFDRRFEGNIELFERFAYEQQRRLFDSTLYRIAMKLVSPARLFRMAASRWRLFHRGIEFIVLDKTDESGRIRLEYPQGAYDAVMLRGLCAGLRAAIDTSAGSASTIVVEEHTAHGAQLRASWRR